MNDYEMIRDCGIGVVMANGNEEVKKIADYITLTLNLDYAIPDNQIIGCACKYKDDNHADMLFVTNDICLKNIARSVGLETTSVEQKKLSYKGYVEKILNEADMAYFYEHSQENIYGLNVNESIEKYKEDYEKYIKKEKVR